MVRPCRLLLWQLLLRWCHMASGSLCLGGTNVLTSVRENSSSGKFISNLTVTGEPGGSRVRLCLVGRDAHWFYLEGRTIRLNTSTSRVLDREVHGPVLQAKLACYEDDVIQGHYGILVEVENENDNRPKFQAETVEQLSISELKAVNSVVFTVKAVDADGDALTYSIDRSSPDADFFRIDFPNSGRVVLDKSVDYESRTQLQVTIWAEESNTEEKFNTSVVLKVEVLDGDDQYPRFLPCVPVSPGANVCINPIYRANVTRWQQGVVQFSPGPIRAEDGDYGISAPLTFSILSGDDDGRFVINNTTGEIELTTPANGPQSNFTLTIMVCQADDHLKYSVTSAVIQVLGPNRFPLVFNTTSFRGFVPQTSGSASIVSTNGNQVLQVQVWDGDFPDGKNPSVRYSVLPVSGAFRVTQEGVLIARTDRLPDSDTHVLQVVARDEASGDEVSTLVEVEVLPRGRAVPRGAFRERQLFGDVGSGLAAGVAILLLLLLSSGVFLLLQSIGREHCHEVEVITLGNHPNLVPAFSDPT